MSNVERGKIVVMVETVVEVVTSKQFRWLKLYRVRRRNRPK